MNTQTFHFQLTQTMRPRSQALAWECRPEAPASSRDREAGASTSRYQAGAW